MDPATKDTVWYVDLDPEDEEDPGIEEIIEADFLVLRTSHYIPGKQRTVRGSLLLTPVQFIFDIVTRDPLDSLEPDMFQAGDFGGPEPEIESMILSEEDRRELARNFPGRCVSRYWLLAFSTLHHGFSLKSLYRNCQDHDGPSLLVIQSKDQEIFGAFLSDAPRVSERFYGTGESWLFSCSSGVLKIYNWRGDNNFILRGNLTSLTIGSDHNGFGLWIDEQLLHGRSQPVQTFKSPSLSSEKDFHINNLELWTFK